MNMDHGILNVPLDKRGNIDAQVDAYKSSEARKAEVARKARAAELPALRAAAKAAVVAADPEMLKRVSAKSSTTLAAVKKSLLSDAYWRPEFVIRVLGAAA